MNTIRTTNKRNTGGRSNPEEARTTRCVIYTRLSTENGLDSGFNSLDVQREACEAYIQSQRTEGWIALPDRYDDGGFSGGNLDRPALSRLLENVQSGSIDCVVVHRVDRISRSLNDFVLIINVLEKNKVSFVSVTQQFNSSTSMGRLTLNILLSFAQFEREIIAERTRDKMCAARRKGKWIGGIPMLGYDIDPKGGKLIVNQSEAEQVREIFKLYLQHQSLVKVAQELNARGWHTKSWIKKNGKRRRGKPFNKTNLHNLLTKMVFLGKVEHQGNIYEGEHGAIIDESLWTQVQQLLKSNSRTGGCSQKNKHGALLKGLVRCAHCRTAMFHTFSQKGNRRYRYYVCSTAQKQGYETCPSRSVPAAELEKFVVERIKEIGKDPTVLDTIFNKVQGITKKDLKNAFSLFDPVWEMLFPREQARIIQLLIERVDYNAIRETLAITFSPMRIRTLSAEVESAQEKKNEDTPAKP